MLSSAVGAAGDEIRVGALPALRNMFFGGFSVLLLFEFPGELHRHTHVGRIVHLRVVFQFMEIEVQQLVILEVVGLLQTRAVQFSALEQGDVVEEERHPTILTVKAADAAPEVQPPCFVAVIEAVMLELLDQVRFVPRPDDACFLGVIELVAEGANGVGIHFFSRFEYFKQRVVEIAFGEHLPRELPRIGAGHIPEGRLIVAAEAIGLKTLPEVRLDVREDGFPFGAAADDSCQEPFVILHLPDDRIFFQHKALVDADADLLTFVLNDRHRLGQMTDREDLFEHRRHGCFFSRAFCFDQIRIERVHQTGARSILHEDRGDVLILRTVFAQFAQLA